MVQAERASPSPFTLRLLVLLLLLLPLTIPHSPFPYSPFPALKSHAHTQMVFAAPEGVDEFARHRADHGDADTAGRSRSQ